jgi:hypothetical protein
LQRPRIVVHDGLTLYAVVFVQISVVVDAFASFGCRLSRVPGGTSMAVVQGGVRFDQIAKKWHALAQRRLGHVRELERSGRWKHLYSEEQFRSYLREAERVAALWAKLAATRFAAPPGGNFNASGHMRRA